MVDDARLALSAARRRAAEADRAPELRLVRSEDVEAFVAGLPPDLEAPSWYGLTLSHDWFAPTLIYAGRGVGKSWAAARIIHQLAGEGLRAGLIATEGLPE